MNEIMKTLVEHAGKISIEKTDDLLGKLIQPDQYIGHLFGMSYGNALVQVHDNDRKRTGGIPGLSFLVASRRQDGVNFDNEDASVLLLRVLDAAPLPTDREAERLRVEAAQRASEHEEGKNWDDPDVIDSFTFMNLGFAGLKCRILGTFYVVKYQEKGIEKYRLQFGSDISNFYSNAALRAYKPNGEALRAIANSRAKSPSPRWRRRSLTRNGRSSSVRSRRRPKRRCSATATKSRARSTSS